MRCLEVLDSVDVDDVDDVDDVGVPQFSFFTSQMPKNGRAPQDADKLRAALEAPQGESRMVNR
jgi:hypothetical protein